MEVDKDALDERFNPRYTVVFSTSNSAQISVIKCVSCKKGRVNAKTAVKRVEWSTIMLDRYPEPEDWDRVRFSDEVHFGWGPQGKLLIIRISGERYCQDFIQEEHMPDKKNKKRHHCWAVGGHNFKSVIHFYNVPGNINEKMSQRVYIDQILNPIVKS